ncbi:MAG TPA: PilZ domain-containing protein [Acidimicrobiia bacterium]|nr:PilZ domain-containing protein [Acidimicrobiia bacterium]
MGSDTTLDTSTTGAGPFAPVDFARRDSFRARVESCAQIRVLRPDASTPGWRRCHLRDLSASGAGVEAVGDDLAPGERVLVRFDGVATAERFQLYGTVVRVAPDSARTMYGIKFDRLLPRQVEQLYSLVMTFARIRQSRTAHVL